MDRPLDADPVTAARVRDALARQALGEQWAAGGRALARELARHLHLLYPKLGNMILAAYAWHREAIRRAVTGGDETFPVTPALTVLIAGSGLPAPGLSLHSRGADANPKARFVYSAPDPWLADVAAQELAALEPDRVSVVLASAMDADAVFAGLPPEALSPGPVSVHIVLVPAIWPPELAPMAIARYAELAPPGSTLCMSLVTGDPGPAGGKMMGDASLAGGHGYCHTPGGVTGGIEDAGLVLHPDGVQDVRALMRGWAVRYPVAPGVPGQVIGAVASSQEAGERAQPLSRTIRRPPRAAAACSRSAACLASAGASRSRM